MTQESGKAIQASTVSKHLFTALSQGRPINLRKLAAAVPPPSRTQWAQLTDAEAAIGKDVVGENVLLTALLEPVLPEALVPWTDRTEEEKATVPPPKTTPLTPRPPVPPHAPPSHHPAPIPALPRPCDSLEPRPSCPLPARPPIS